MAHLSSLTPVRHTSLLSFISLCFGVAFFWQGGLVIWFFGFFLVVFKSVLKQRTPQFEAAGEKVMFVITL